MFQDYKDIRFELSQFSGTITQKEEIIVFSKADLLDQEMRDHIVETFETEFPGKKIFVISAATNQ